MKFIQSIVYSINKCLTQNFKYVYIIYTYIIYIYIYYINMYMYIYSKYVYIH